MRVNDKTDFVAAKVCSLQNESWKWTFWERILLSRLIVPCRTTSSVANSLQNCRERNLTLLANEEIPNFLRSQQANRRSRGKLFRINCPITNLWNELTASRWNFFPWKASKNSSWVKSEKTDEVNKVRYKWVLLKADPRLSVPRPSAHGPPRPSDPAARRPSGLRPVAYDGPAARRPSPNFPQFFFVQR